MTTTHSSATPYTFTVNVGLMQQLHRIHERMVGVMEDEVRRALELVG
jgi:hypothetical protein